MTPEIEKDSRQPAIPRWLRQVVSLFHRKPKPPEKKPMWEGKCACCGGRVVCWERIPEPNETVECQGCAWHDAEKRCAMFRSVLL
jgi:hypothetical protein